MCKMENDDTVAQSLSRGERAGFRTEGLASDTIMKTYLWSQKERLSRCLLMWVNFYLKILFIDLREIEHERPQRQREKQTCC